MPERSVGTDVAPALGVTVAALIDARADVFSSGAAVADGERGGVLPTRVTLPAGAARVVISHGSGRVGCGTGEEPTSPAGGACAGGHTDIESAGSISGIVDATRTQFLVGVFVGTPLGAAPARLDVAPGQAGEAQSLAPALGQTFYVGDGGGRAFAVPAGSVALYLGVADAWGFQGPPSYYADNTGGFRVELRAE